MNVYIEYVILDNFLIDLIVLAAAFKTLKLKTKTVYLILSAALGTAFAVIVPIVKLNTVIEFISKVLISLLMVFIPFSGKNVKKFLMAYALFVFYTFLLGGMIIGVFFFTKTDFSAASSINYVGDIPVSLIICSPFLLFYFVDKVVKYIYRRKNVFPFTRKISVYYNDRKTDAVGFIDTGNRLYDKITGGPVIVCDKSFALKILADGLFEKNTKCRYMEVSTVNGVNKIMLLNIPKLLIYNADELNIIENITLGISAQGFKNGGEYQVLLHPDIV